MIEHVFKPNISACMKSKRIAQREMDAQVMIKKAEFNLFVKYLQ